jgi:hypothetical protein
MGDSVSAEISEYLARAIAILESSPLVCERFAEERAWLKLRREHWLQPHWRVGVLGITSSGKSTLLNALLGERLLPSGVRPSSNCMIVCEHGTTREARVVYEGGRRTVIRTNISEHLARLGDEARNPGNHKGVREIRLCAPGFRPDSDVALIDSPGLDAYGCDEHERITLQLLLPTVDMVMYVATTKPSSDREVARYLDAIGAARPPDLPGVPVVVVQNMTDTVGPKIGAGGAVLRTREEVLDEHAARLGRLLERSPWPWIQRAAIVQTSARRAMESGADSESGIDALIDTLHEGVEALRPHIESARCEQLSAHLDALARREFSDDETQERALFVEQASLARWRDAIEEFTKKIETKLNKLEASLQRAVVEAAGRAEALAPTDRAGAQALTEHVSHWMEPTHRALAALVTSMQAEAREVAKALNLRPDDAPLDGLVRGHQQQAIDPAIDLITHRCRRDAPGMAAWFKRKFGFSGGYTYEEWQSEVVDVPLTRKRIMNRLAGDQRRFDDTRRRIEDAVERYAKSFLDEVRRRQRALDDRRKTVIPREERLSVSRALATLHAEIVKGLRPLKEQAAARRAPPRSSGHMMSKQFPPWVPYAARLVALLSQRRAAEALDVWLLRAPPRSRRRLLLWSWDRSETERFVARHLPTITSEATAEPTFATRTHAGLDYLQVVDASRIEVAAGGDVLRRFGSEPGCIACLISAQQIGHSTSQLVRAGIAEHSGQQASMFAVLGDAESLWGTVDFVPAIHAFREAIVTARLAPAAYLANHRDARVSALVDALLQQRLPLATQRDELFWLERMRFDDPRDPATGRAAEVIKTWRRETGE